MEKNESLVMKGIEQIVSAAGKLAGSMKTLFAAQDAHDSSTDNHMEEHDMKAKYHGDQPVLFSRKVLDEFRENVGRFRPETGGMLACTSDERRIDLCHFDTHSKNTAGTFYYDVQTMTAVYHGWKAKNYITNGIYHSHPHGVIRPSYHDISSGLLHMDFFHLDYFYLPIFQPQRNGLYTMYFYELRKVGEYVELTLGYVLKATQDSYELVPSRPYQAQYAIHELISYRESVDRSEAAYAPRRDAAELQPVSTPENGTVMDTSEYFRKVSSLYPDNVLDKVIVCIGTGGARSFLENCARSGFRNYVLIDADTVSPTNIATQAVFISEMGKKKVEVIRDRILDINPAARVVCVDRFLDNNMSDAEFKSYLDRFPNRKSTDYLILGCTDNFEAQKRSSLLALKYGAPYLAAMMYAGGAAAEMIFVYPGVTESCPRCLLRDRFEKYEHGFINDVDSSGCPIFATERMNALKGYIALMLLMYREDDGNPLSNMLDSVKDRNFVEIRLTPYLKDSPLGIDLFDRVFDGASRYVFFDETLWIPQHPDRPEFGSEPCKLCGGTGDLTHLQEDWKETDTRYIRFDSPDEEMRTA